MAASIATPLLRAFAIALLAALSNALTCQCFTTWAPSDGVPGTTGPVSATTMWDRDGGGPQSPVLVVAGWFGDTVSQVIGVAGNVRAMTAATYDPVTGDWSEFDWSLEGPCRAVAALPDGRLFFAGDFSFPGGGSAKIVQWDDPLTISYDSHIFGDGSASTISHMVVLPNGDLVIAGNFTVVGGDHFDLMARWDGSAWSAFGGLDPTTGVSVTGLEVLSNGDLVAAFWDRVARWTGTGWALLGDPFDLPVRALARLPNGEIAAGGEFTKVNYDAVNNTFVTARLAAKWNGTTWAPFGSGTQFVGNPIGIRDLAVLPNGDLIAGGAFSSVSGAVRQVARWSGTAWVALGYVANTAPNEVSTMQVLPNGDLVIGGGFSRVGPIAAHNIARWNGSSWARLANGFGASVTALAASPDGRLVAGGTFDSAGTLTTQGVATWDGANWVALGSGVGGVVNAVAILPSGDVVVGLPNGGVGGSSGVRRWNGTAWSLMGSTGSHVAGDVYALAVMPNGDLVAGGWFSSAGGVSANSIARWNGSSWSAIGSGVDGDVRALLTIGNSLVVGGQFTTAGGVSANSIAVVDTTTGTWSSLGSGVGGLSPQVLSLARLPTGDIVAGGAFTAAGGSPRNYIARWDGANWHGMGGTDAEVSAMAVLPNGDLVAGGGFSFAGGVPCERLARWDGSVWSSVEGGVDAGASGRVYALAVTGRGLAVGGEFRKVGQNVSPYFAWLDTTCPASAVAYGVGCPSSGGNNTLTAETPPWVDATFRARGTGLPSTAIVIAATSVTPIPQGVFPLTSVFGQAGPGCDLLVAPDILEAMVTLTGTATSSLFLPNTPPLVGVTFYHQMVPIELDGLGNWLATTSTNALQLTAGIF